MGNNGIFCRVSRHLFIVRHILNFLFDQSLVGLSHLFKLCKFICSSVPIVTTVVKQSIYFVPAAFAFNIDGNVFGNRTGGSFSQLTATTRS